MLIIVLQKNTLYPDQMPITCYDRYYSKQKLFSFIVYCTAKHLNVSRSYAYYLI